MRLQTQPCNLVAYDSLLFYTLQRRSLVYKDDYNEVVITRHYVES